jgi:uncharacterized protein YidB (DUF937 family)
MMLETIKAVPAGTTDTVVIDTTKLFDEVIRMVQNMPGGVSGLVTQFQDKGLGCITSTMNGNGTRPISPERIAHGLGTERMDALVAASGLHERVVRKELVTMLPRVCQQLALAGRID